MNKGDQLVAANSKVANRKKKIPNQLQISRSETIN